jgi:two-component sensor histidine kinase
MPPRAARTISTVLHELATNPGKHGALSNPHGQITVRWEHMTDKNGSTHLLLT